MVGKYGRSNYYFGVVRIDISDIFKNSSREKLRKM